MEGEVFTGDLNKFLVHVLNQACRKDAFAIVFQNHRYPIWAEVVSKTKTEIFYDGDSDLERLKDILSGISNAQSEMSFGGVHGMKAFKLSFSSDRIWLTSGSPTVDPSSLFSQR